MKQYKTPTTQTFIVSGGVVLQAASQTSTGPTADFMSGPTVSETKNGTTQSHTVWDDDWSK